MRALLHNLLLEFAAENPQVQDGWQALFDLEIKTAAAQPEPGSPDIRLAAVVTTHLPHSPAARPSYIQPGTAGQGRPLRYYETERGGRLDLPRPAQITFDFLESAAQITLTPQGLDARSLEDLTLIALSPFLRRRGFFMLHAFAAARESAVLLCGPPGSGKTTTGLALLKKGWRYLANDAALLRDDAGQVKAYPSPGAINLHPRTLALLPDFQDRLPPVPQPVRGGKHILSRGTLLLDQEHADPTVVGTILFPCLTNQAQESLHEVTPAIGLARLIEENIDQWDRGTHAAHFDLLTRLSRQANFFDLHLPRGRLPNPGLLNALDSA